MDISSSDWNMPLADYVYEPLVESPGVAYVINLEEFLPATTQPLLSSIFSVWPAVLLTVSTACLSGIIIWLLVSGTPQTPFKNVFKLSLFFNYGCFGFYLKLLSLVQRITVIC